VFNGNVINLTMACTAGAKLTLGSDVTVDGVLTMTSGEIFTSSSALLIMNGSATTSGASDASFVDGPVKKLSGSSTFTFPIGKDATGYMFLRITAPSTATDFVAEYIRDNPRNVFGEDHITGIVSMSSCEYWTLTPTSGSGTVNLSLAGNSHNGCIIGGIDNTGASYFTGGGSNISTLMLIHYNDIAMRWESASGSVSTTGTYPAYTITATGVSSFSPFTWGSSGGNPVPVKLISFTGQQTNNGAILDWATATEKDNDHFDLERSFDGSNFLKVGEVPGHGNSTSIVNYSYADYNEASAAVVYYRLKQVDYNGAFEYSNIVTLTPGTKANISILNQSPNPFGDHISVNYNMPSSGSAIIKINDELGRTVSSTQVNANRGVNVIQINTSDLAKGIYMMNIEYNGVSSEYTRLIKK